VTPPGPGRDWRGWLGAPDRYGLVLVLILVSALLVALAGPGWGLLPAVLALAGTLLFTLHTSRAPPRVQRLARWLVGAAVGLGLLASASGREALAAGVLTAVAVLLVVATPPAIVRRLQQHPVVDAATVLGALCIYLLLGLAFALGFGLTAVLDGGPFFATVAAARPVDYLYFSFVTLTTVGYGDLTARGDLGRMLAVTEALAGQLYLVAVVALLVGNVGRPRPPRPGRAPEDES